MLFNARTGSSRDSLFGVLNLTRTSVGRKLLRSQLVSPSNDAKTLNTRLDCVSELLVRPEVCA